LRFTASSAGKCTVHCARPAGFGFAGDCGFLHPELTRSATQEQVEELGNQPFDKYICSNRTCEIGMNLATGKDYRSVIFLLEELTRA
jgi:D-lactate dehydrogenase